MTSEQFAEKHDSNQNKHKIFRNNCPLFINASTWFHHKNTSSHITNAAFFIKKYLFFHLIFLWTIKLKQFYIKKKKQTTFFTLMHYISYFAPNYLKINTFLIEQLYTNTV